MRLWSLHPKYLDSKGLVAAWREGLLAQKCLMGQTKGYYHHPQLLRFKNSEDPLAFMGAFLLHLYLEAEARGYSFDASKIKSSVKDLQLPVAEGQVRYEWAHLLAKVKARDPSRYAQIVAISLPDVHPLFKVVRGGVEAWERIK